jgi:MYXO-CTERM domain-containing protein
MIRVLLNVLRLGPVALLVVAGCFDPGAETERRQSPVIGGSPTPGGAYLATGALIAYGNGSNTPAQYVSCTGTLIAPDVVLTAAHCTHPALTNNTTPDFTLALDGMNAQAGQIYSGSMALAHPSFDPYGGSPPSNLSHEYDIGLLFLDAPVPGATYERLPRPGELAAIASGSTVDIVGYGFTVEQDLDHYGTKYNATTSLTGVAQWEVKVGGSGQPQNCQGDSGGPALLTVGNSRRVISVVSRSAVNDTTDCSQGGIHTRVDPYLEWIHQQVDVPCGSGLSADCAGATDAGPSSGGTPDASPLPGSPDAGAATNPGSDGGQVSNPADDDHVCSGCRAGGQPSGSVVVLLALALFAVRRRP